MPRNEKRGQMNSRRNNERKSKDCRSKWREKDTTEKVISVLRISAVFIGICCVLIVIVELIENYRTRWRYQQEMAAVTTEINYNQTYSSKPITVYEDLASELRAAAISDGYSDSERILLLNDYLGDLMSFGNNADLSIRVDAYSGYNVPALLVTYTYEPDSVKKSTDSAEVESFSVESSSPTARDVSGEDSFLKNTDSEDMTLEISNSDTEDLGDSSLDNSGLIDSNLAEYSSEGANEYVDIGLNDEITSSIPAKNEFLPDELLQLLDTILQETPFRFCYVKIFNSGVEQFWYISKSIKVELSALLTDKPLCYNGDSIEGFQTGTLNSINIYSGKLPDDYDESAVVDAYFCMVESIKPDSIGVLAYKDSYLFYIGEISGITELSATLENCSANQLIVKRVKFYSETQFMSNDFANVLAEYLSILGDL